MRTSCSRVNTGNFTKRSSNADDNQRDENPAPDDIAGATADERVEEGGGETVGNGGEDKGHEGDLGGRAVARQLGLVAQGLEEVVGIVLDGEAGGVVLVPVLVVLVHLGGAVGVEAV